MICIRILIRSKAAVDAGKSSICGVLTSGELDDGRGSARSKIFVHRHEHQNGRTASISQHVYGFTAEHEPVFNSAPANAPSLVKTRAWTSIVSQSKKILTFVDLCGHESYLHTSITGLIRNQIS